MQRIRPARRGAGPANVRNILQAPVNLHDGQAGRTCRRTGAGGGAQCCIADAEFSLTRIAGEKVRGNLDFIRCETSQAGGQLHDLRGPRGRRGEPARGLNDQREQAHAIVHFILA